MKNYYPKKNNKILSFVKGRGFYLVLMLCVAAVGAVGYLSVKNIISDVSDDEWSQIAQSRDEDVQSDGDKTAPVGKPQEGITASSGLPSVSSKANASSQEGTKNKVLTYHMPLAGSILTKFSVDTPVFSKTLGDWRTHNGIDIKGTIGQEVIASADGLIEDVYNDELKGYTIVISHSDGVKTIYSGLQSTSLAKKGKTVFAGDLIGKLGATNVFEAEDETHLHFEMIKSGIQLNPTDMVKS